MTKSISRHWRLPLLAIVLLLIASLQFYSAGASSNDVVTLTEFPKDYQLYPRNSSNKGTITVAGEITTGSAGTAVVNVKRNGSAYTTASASYGSGTDVPFSIDVQIDAELADYSVELRTGANELKASADYIVAGDVYVIQGQSNAVAGMYTNDDDGDASNDPAVTSSASAQNDYVRTYSSGTGDPSVLTLDDNWYIADGDGFNDHGAIGQWGLKMADTLVDSTDIPMAIINGAFGGEEISFFQRNDDDKTDLRTNYGRLLYRMEKSGLQDDVKAIFWYQGESDKGDVDLHLEGFDAIYNDWKEDYPSTDTIYTFQIADFCFGDNLDQREAQRRLPEIYSDVKVFSTNAIKGHRLDCHYWWQDGYETLGENAARAVSADFYAGSAIDSDAPDLERAYFSAPVGSNAEKTRITLQLKNVDSGLNFDDYRTNGSGNTALYRFKFFSDVAGENIHINDYTVDSANGRIIFDIQTGWDSNGPVPPTGNLTAHFEGDPWLKMGDVEADQDNVTNGNGVGLMTFNAKVFESAESPEAIIYAEDFDNTGNPTQGTLSNGSFSVSLKGDRSNDPNNDINQMYWTFGDGTVGYGTNEFHTYTQSGTYEVTLRVRDGQGNFDYAKQTVLVFADTSAACTSNNLVHGLNYERFDNLTGTSVSDLTTNADFTSADSHSYIEDFEIPENIGDEYGARVRGYIVPPISGEYEFWVSSDDESEVYLYTVYDKSHANFSLPTIAQTISNDPLIHITGSHSQPREFEDSFKAVHGSSYTQWDQYVGQTYFSKNLEVGKLYYVEALYKEGTAGDHLSLGWRLPGAKNYTLIENANLCVARTDLDLAPLPEINAKPSGEENGTPPFGEAPLTILFDGNETVDDDGDINNATFIWSFGDGNVNNNNTQATAHEYRTPGTYYSVLSVQDEDGYINNAVQKIEVVEPDCSVEANGVLFERFDNVGGRTIEDMFTADPAGAIPTYDDAGPSYVARLNTFEMPENVGDEYAARFRGFIVPDSTGGHVFRIAGDDQAVMFLSTDADPANKVAIASVTNMTTTAPTFDTLTGSIGGSEGWTPVRDWLNTDVKYPNQESAMITLTAGQRYYVEVLYKEELFNDHLSIGWQVPGSTTFDLILCHNLEPFNSNGGGSGELPIHNLEINVEQSHTTVPESGALIEYRVTLTNASADELGADPIQINSIVDSLHGDIASNAAGWETPFVENTCWWWIPELWNGQSWTCSYTKWVEGAGQTHNVTVNAVSNSGLTIAESADAEYVGFVGPGVKSTNAWAADGQSTIELFTQMVDTDHDIDTNFDVYSADIRDTEGILIGDFDLDGVCDMWQTWWLRNCIALSTSEVMSVLDDTSSTDMRDRMLRSLTATWLNIIAGNEYECADMKTAVNLGLIWLDDNGNPLDGGSAISETSYTWTQIEYTQVWYDWYNDTGGNYCGETASGSSATCGSLAQEAEIAGNITNPNNGKDYIFGNRIKVFADSAANGGEFIQGKTNQPSQWSMKFKNNKYSSPHRAVYCVDIPADGYYVIDAWVRTPSGGNDDSYFVQFNSGPYVLWDTTKHYNDFGYSDVSNRAWGGATARWYLTAGEHKLKFHLRENGTQLDRFVVKADATRSEVQAIDGGTPEAYVNGGPLTGPSDHYMYQWLVDGNNIPDTNRSGEHSGEFATAMSGFLTDSSTLTEVDEIEVGGAVGHIAGHVDVDATTEDAIHEAGVEHFAPSNVVVPTAISMSDLTTGAIPSSLSLMMVLISMLSVGVLGLYLRRNKNK